MQGVVHVTQKLRPGLPGLRQRAEIEVIRAALQAGNERPGFRVVAFSALNNHLHLGIEVRSTAELSRAMQGLAIRLAKALNKLWRRRGNVFLERFHARLAEGISAIRRVLVYVLNNARKHGVRLAPGVPDPYSSGPWFPYWRAQPGSPRPQRPAEPSPVAEIRDLGLVMATWGMGIGVDDTPADRRRAWPLDVFWG
jgi:REP element-mobilizing transposase RayT